MGKVVTVEQYISNSTAWRQELDQLRHILLQTGLEETIKWGMPCYTHNGKNVVGMASFKHYFGLWFHQGALIEDTHNKLVNAQEGKTKALRQWRMTRSRHIKPTIIKRYVKASIANIENGVSIGPTRAPQRQVPPELQHALDDCAVTKKAFEKLSVAKRREFSGYVSEAKRDSTRIKRVEKILPMIRQGVGLHDRYR